MLTGVSSAINANATHLHLQILPHRFDSFEHLRRNPVEKIPFKIGEDMRGGACGENLFVFLIQDPIVKDQFGHLGLLHRRLDEEGSVKAGREFELAIQFYDWRQKTHLLKL